MESGSCRSTNVHEAFKHETEAETEVLRHQTGENKALQISDEARPKQSVETEVLRLRPHPKSDWVFCRGTAHMAWRCNGYGIGPATLKVVGSTPGLLVSDDNLGLAVHTHTCLCHQSV